MRQGNRGGPHGPGTLGTGHRPFDHSTGCPCPTLSRATSASYPPATVGSRPIADIEQRADDGRMNLLLPLILIASAPFQAEPAETYLLSVVDVPLTANESIEKFTLSTWGVTFSAVCEIPSGWTIKAGNSLTPEGVLEGEGSLGISWFPESSPPELREFTLITLYGSVRNDAATDPNGSGEVPATFSGSATISTDDGEKRVPLTAANIRLTPADRCPDR